MPTSRRHHQPPSAHTGVHRSGNEENKGKQTRKWEFDHHRLDAFDFALEALVQGERITRGLPRGYGKLGDQLRRALQGAYLQTSEAAARTGADRLARFRAARAEACESAAALEALVRLGVAEEQQVEPVLELLWRLCAMLTRLARLRRR